MAHRNQLVGIIDLDADPKLDATLDETIGRTLQRLRGATPTIVHSESTGSSFRPDGLARKRVDDATSESVVVLKADLRQLHRDLQSELVKMLNRLLRHGNLDPQS